MKKILLVDDDVLFAETLSEQLSEEDFSVTVALCANKAKALWSQSFDMILLDRSLPDGDGKAICQTLRQQGITTPIIMLTGAGEENDIITGLDAGANDYVAKPFRLNELLARIRAQLRIHEQNDDAHFVIGPYDFHPASKMLMRDSRKIRLTEKETAILKFLYRNKEGSSREQLLEEIWGYNSGMDTHTVETHIYRLRQKIEENPKSAAIVVTTEGGYKLGQV